MEMEKDRAWEQSLYKINNPKDETDFAVTVSYGRIPLIRVLLDKKIPYDLNAIKIAIITGRARIIQWLLRHTKLTLDNDCIRMISYMWTYRFSHYKILHQKNAQDEDVFLETIEYAYRNHCFLNYEIFCIAKDYDFERVSDRLHQIKAPGYYKTCISGQCIRCILDIIWNQLWNSSSNLFQWFPEEVLNDCLFFLR